ncbi:MAG: tyrosine-type recombinase/integrase [Chroococcidiopsis sp.]
MASNRVATAQVNEFDRSSQSISQSRKKALKGTVVVQVFKDRLRLCWSYGSKRYFLYIGLPDSKVNRGVAERKARQIEGDIATGNFDSTLKKYKSDSQLERERKSVVCIFQQFTQERAKGLYARSLEKYETTLNYLTQYFRDKPADTISASCAEQFAKWLSTKTSPITTRQRLILIKACWDWAIRKHLIELHNLWVDVVRQVKVPPKQMPKPFTKEEISTIISAFRSDRYYSHYADFVEFLFGTGCRTSEAIGLRWGHLSDNCATAWIGETLSRGVRKPTKTNRARSLSLTARLQAMLLARRPQNPNPDELVFPSPKGEAIDDRNFRNRAWKTILASLKIVYRKPYTTRHTLISHALDLGMNPVLVAQLTGHDVETLYHNYAGNVNSRPMLPELEITLEQVLIHEEV